jgi:hypothetical protein
MSRDTEFLRSTIAYRRRRWTEDQEWRPYRQKDRLVEGRQIFTDAQEEIIAQIEGYFWSRNWRLSLHTFRDLVLEYWRGHRQATEQCGRFSASNRFRLALFRRHRLSFRVPSQSRDRPVQSPAVVAAYKQAIKLAAARYGESRVVNMDETSWHDVQCRVHTIAQRDLRQVRATVKGNMKAAVSAICTVGRNGRKFQPLYVLRATSANVRTELSIVPLARIIVSENGWMTEKVMW